MKKLAAIAFLVSAVAAATAGARYSPAVSVNTSSRSAYGSLGTARNSADAYQYIGCYTAVSSSSRFVECYATMSNSVWAYCYSSDPTFFEQARSINSDSYLYFTWDANGVCNYLQVANDSTFEPKR